MNLTSARRETLSVHAGLNGVIYDSTSSVLVKYKKRRTVPGDNAQRHAGDTAESSKPQTRKPASAAKAIKRDAREP